jgi:hypothetical protein
MFGVMMKMMIITNFKFFVGKVERIIFSQPRYPRVITCEVPYPEEYNTTDLKRIFRRGWRACEYGRDIYENPYSVREELIYTLHRAWERGWLECYHNHPSRQNTH